MNNELINLSEYEISEKQSIKIGAHEFGSLELGKWFSFKFEGDETYYLVHESVLSDVEAVLERFTWDNHSEYYPQTMFAYIRSNSKFSAFYSNYPFVSVCTDSVCSNCGVSYRTTEDRAHNQCSDCVSEHHKEVGMSCYCIYCM